MKILLLNPNTSTFMTERLAAAASTVLSPGTELVPLTATRGVPYISSRAEAQIAGVIALEMLAEHAESADAAVIAAFGDPGLRAARELFDLPVVGMAEASLLTACMLGERFGIVTFTPRMAPWYADVVRDAGLTARCTGLRTAKTVNGHLNNVQTTMRTELVRLATDSALQDGADVVILGGAPLAGLAFGVRADVPAVCLDPISAAVRQAETLVRLAPEGANRGCFARPPGKESDGLEPGLSAWLAAGPMKETNR